MPKLRAQVGHIFYHGQKQWYSENFKNGKLKHILAQLVTCRGRETHLPDMTPFVVVVSKVISDSGSPPRPEAPLSSPTPTLSLPELGVIGAPDVVVAELARGRQLLSELSANSEHKQHLAEAATAELKEKLATTTAKLKEKLASARAGLKIL